MLAHKVINFGSFKCYFAIKYDLEGQLKSINKKYIIAKVWLIMWLGINN